jgi:hypothetical protein
MTEIQPGIANEERRDVGLAWWAACTILVSAFLLFQVQPVISKKILPWFGGSPAVWTTCVLFFQVLLLGGYTYAHLLTRMFRPRMQGLIHAVLICLALFTLPITPADGWKPIDGSMPAMRILLLLAAKVGVPYFLLSSTNPLVQSWFSLAFPGRSPYRLYALSNFGSLAALLTYPFWFETAFTVNTQGNLWSLGFVVFALLCGGLGVMIWRMAGILDAAQAQRASARDERSNLVDEGPAFIQKFAWLLLAALPCVMFLAATNHLCQDIAVVPFMWIAPLSLYLISLIICFDREIWYSRKFFGTASVLSIFTLAALKRSGSIDDFLTRVSGWINAGLDYFGYKLLHNLSFTGSVDLLLAKSVEAINWVAHRDWLARRDVLETITLSDLDESVIFQSALYLLVVFLVCMVCHGELVKSKPKPRFLTMFYLMISAGGALGGLFVAIICPLVFKTDFELPLAIITGFVVAWIALANDGRDTWLAGREVLQWIAAFVVVGALILVGWSQIEPPDDNVLALTRNFYGRLKVRVLDPPTEPADPPGESTGRALYHGRIWHGFQYLTPARLDEPTAYYAPGTGVGVAVQHYPRLPGEGMRVGVIGLGAGTMAAYAQKGDVYRFYDINPDVIRVSDAWFSFRSRAAQRGAKIDTILGDARIQLEREPDQAYDVIVLDAFSGDAIPAHLLTAEALDIYERHLRRDKDGKALGIIAVHISNRYLDLEPVVAALSRAKDFPARIVHFEQGIDVGDTSADWILLTRNPKFLATTDTLTSDYTGELVAYPLELEDGKKEVMWTDQKSNLFEILK